MEEILKEYFLFPYNNWNKQEIVYDFDKTEPILSEPEGYKNSMNVKHKDIQELNEKASTSIWFAQSVDFSKDVFNPSDYNNKVLDVLKLITSFFICADSIIVDKLKEKGNVTEKVKLNESRRFYTIQQLIESVHDETYSRIATILSKNNEFSIGENEHNFFIQIANIKGTCVNTKLEFMKFWFEHDFPFRVKILALACIEGLMFSSGFAFYRWLSNPSRVSSLSGVSLANQYIMRDESLHALHSLLLYSKLEHQLDQEYEIRLIKVFAEKEIEFVRSILRDGSGIDIIEDLKCSDIEMGIKYLANSIFSKIRPGKKIFNDVSEYNLPDFVNQFQSEVSFLERDGYNYMPSAYNNISEISSGVKEYLSSI